MHLLNALESLGACSATGLHAVRRQHRQISGAARTCGALFTYLRTKGRVRVDENPRSQSIPQLVFRGPGRGRVDHHAARAHRGRDVACSDVRRRTARRLAVHDSEDSVLHAWRDARAHGDGSLQLAATRPHAGPGAACRRRAPAGAAAHRHRGVLRAAAASAAEPVAGLDLAVVALHHASSARSKACC